jgi:hypothetical protein
MNNEKITVPANVANAIAHYVNLADNKTQAFTDILSLGYEAERSEIILRHFDQDYDELMQALICGYEVEKSPEDLVRDFYNATKMRLDEVSELEADYYYGIKKGIEYTLGFLGIKITEVND